MGEIASLRLLRPEIAAAISAKNEKSLLSLCVTLSYVVGVSPLRELEGPQPLEFQSNPATCAADLRNSSAAKRRRIPSFRQEIRVEGEDFRRTS